MCPERVNTGAKSGQAPLLQNKGLTVRLYYCIRRRTTRKIGWAKTIWFCSSSFVPSASFVRSANFETRQLSKILTLSLLDRRVLAKGLICARDWNNFLSRVTDSRGTDSNNFVVATYYLLRRQLSTSKSLVFRPTPKTVTSYCETVPWC